MSRKSRRGKLKSYAQVKGLGEICRHCDEVMERRERIKPPERKTYFYTEWDYCKKCSRIYHYDQYKSSQWQEDERQQNFLSGI